MSHHRALRGTGLMAVAAILSFACGGGGGGTGGGGATKGTIKIGVEMPLSGTEGSQGQPILKGVRFAVDRAGGAIKGYKLEVVDKDDAVNGTHDPQKGAQNVQALVGDPEVLSFVGPLNSSVALNEIPIAADAHLAMISPANTGVCLTKAAPDPRFPYDAKCNGENAQIRKGNPNPYFRVVTTDDYQGPAMADYFLQVLHVTKVAVGDDTQTYGKGIALSFAAEFKAKGGTIVGPYPYDYDQQNTTDFKTWLTAAKNAGAQAIYVGGVTSTKVCIVRSQMQGIFDVSTPFGGGDGIVQDSECVKAMGPMSTNVFSSIAAVDPVHVPSAQSVITAYKKANPGPNDYTAYSIVAADAAGIEIAAIGRAIDAANGKMPTREQVRAEVAKTKDYQGALGSTSFDEFGDTNVKIISIYEYTSSDPNQANDEPWKAQINYGESNPTVKTQ
ncbi:MAG TPA: branched-chain amino acid ABC transporter substrate-binding protein [Candidatus Dormibacteraeota bacterium]|nr:branched-chain amino acid ABC transporter substrate-binding protein [Candidatus Dormibacteraeota bacterium]